MTVGALSPEAIAGFVAAGVGLLGIAVTLYIRWSGRRVGVGVEVREAWKPPRFYVATIDTLDSLPTDPTVFEATVAVTNRGERSVFVEQLAIELVNEPLYGYKFDLGRRPHEIPPGGLLSEAVDEEQVSLDLRGGFRGYAQLAGEEKPRWSEVFLPVEPPDDVRYEPPPTRLGP